MLLFCWGSSCVFCFLFYPVSKLVVLFLFFSLFLFVFCSDLFIFLSAHVFICSHFYCSCYYSCSYLFLICSCSFCTCFLCSCSYFILLLFILIFAVPVFIVSCSFCFCSYMFLYFLCISLSCILCFNLNKMIVTERDIFELNFRLIL